MSEMVIDSIRVSLMNYQRVVILKEKSSDRYLPIWIGPAEADAIALRLQDVQVPRPLTHDLLGAIVVALGAKVLEIVVNDLQNDTFFAKLVLETDGKRVEVDARPSDAIAVAVRTRAPIYADGKVLEKAGVVLDQEGGKGLVQEKAGMQESASRVEEGELRKLSAYKDFIETLNLEDLGKGKS
ncbi:MAG: bifunctional nuclease family protein [Chloroflexi bacterium]|nr:bifunctional nuclease family protein [Chloroflexota bacterium]